MKSEFDYIIEGRILKAGIKAKGAQLCSLTHLPTGNDVIWNGNAEYWNKHAPILFPFVGSLQDDTFLYKGKEYPIERHGFARDLTFELEDRDDHYVVLRLMPNSYTKQRYPFDFELTVSYRIEGHMLLQSFVVTNKGDVKMPYSVGGHPAFNADPIDEYEIVFDRSELIDAPLLQDGLVSYEKVEALNGQTLQLGRHTFDRDALIFTKLKSDRFSLRHRPSNTNILTLDKGNFPHMGIWSKPGAPFVCIEPWHGMADQIGLKKDVFDKFGIISLDAGESRRHFFSIIVHDQED